MKSKVYCNVCGRSIPAGFDTQWKHLVKNHPIDLFGRLIPMLFNPEMARDAGRRLGESLKRGIQ